MRQVVLRSTAIAGLFLAGAVVYFDPDFSDEGLMGDAPGVGAAPVSADVYADIDPLVSASWPSVTAADSVRQAEDAADVRKADAFEGNPAPASSALTIAPTPARNPFHVAPEPSAVRDGPVLLRDYE
jgi:hypothetical protein